MPKQTANPVTTADMAVVFPLQADREPRLTQGIFIGLLASGEPFYWDPYAAYVAGLIGSLSRVILGQVNYRKSTQIKTEICVAATLVSAGGTSSSTTSSNMTSWRKSLASQPITFGDVKINPIDPNRLGRNEQQAMLANMVQLARERFEPLPDLEYGALSAALDQVMESHARPTIMAVVEALFERAESAAAAIHVSVDKLREMGFSLALTLQRFIGDGDLGGVFDGETTPGFDLSGDLVVLNFSTIGESMRPLMVSVVSTWLEAAWQHGNKDLLFDHVILEECWEYLRHPSSLGGPERGAKLQRQYGVAYTYVLHGLSDLLAAGTANSEQVRLAEGLVRDAQVTVLFLQDAGEREHLKRVLNLPTSSSKSRPSSSARVR